MNLDELITQTKNTRIPACPSRVEKNVLRRLGDAPPSAYSLCWFLPSTGFQLGAVALVMLLTFISTLGVATLQAKQHSHREQVAQALNFDVFHDLSLYKAQRKF